MFTINKYKFSKITLLNFFIIIIPIGLVAGNTVTNAIIFIICVLGLIVYGKQIFIIEKKIYQYLLYIFFFYLILITLINNLPLLEKSELYKEHIIKSIFYLRFLILFLIINKLIEKEEFKIRLFFISCALLSLFLSIDSLIQFFFKKNIIGYPLLYNRPTSFFNQEFILGGFLQKFSLFLIFYFLSKKNEDFNLQTFLLFAFALVPIVLAGNKMPLLIFVSCFFTYFLIIKRFKEIFLLICVVFLIFASVYKLTPNNRIKSDYGSFLNETKLIFLNSYKLFVFNEKNFDYYWSSGYLIHFNSGVQVWKKNKISGAGLKSFRLNCTFEKNQTCNTHPHNYLIEIMVDTGLIGVFLFYLIFFFSLSNFFKYYYKENNQNIKKISIVFFLLIFFELFPFRSTGSFFSTSNSAFLFLILPMFLNIDRIKKL